MRSQTPSLFPRRVAASFNNRLGAMFLLVSTVAILAMVCFVVFVKISSPKYVDIRVGTTTFEQIIIEGKTCLRVQGVEGSPQNQIEEMGYLVDPSAKTVRIFAYKIVFNPFSKVISHARWPLILDLTRLPTGEYRVECLDGGKFQEVGRFIKPAEQTEKK